MASEADRELVALVQRLINTGSRRIRLPSALAVEASDEAREAIRGLCRINEVEIEVGPEAGYYPPEIA